MSKASDSNLKSFMALSVILQTLLNLGGLFLTGERVVQKRTRKQPFVIARSLF